MESHSLRGIRFLLAVVIFPCNLMIKQLLILVM